MSKVRAAVIQRSHGRPAPESVQPYMPRNYSVSNVTEDAITITGRDYAGWTLDGYVIPRLGSGLIHAYEIEVAQPTAEEVARQALSVLDDAMALLTCGDRRDAMQLLEGLQEEMAEVAR